MMKRILIVMALAVLIAISVFTETHSDYIPPKQPAPEVIKESVEVISIPKGVPKENVQYYLLVYAEFKNTPMMAIATAENRPFDPVAKNPNSSAQGLFQIIKGTWKLHRCTGLVTVAEDNIACAKKIYESEGTRPWDASKGTWGKLVVAK